MELRMKSKRMSLHRKAQVTNSRGEILYCIHSKAVSLHDSTFVSRGDGAQVAIITRRPVSVHSTHLIQMADGREIELRAELLHLTKDVLDIDTLGWHLVGDVVQRDYWLMDGEGQMLAQARRKWLTLHNTYEIEVEEEGQLDTIIAVLAALDKIVEDRRRAVATPGASQGEGH